jgi:excisionase family DNA binding protein
VPADSTGQRNKFGEFLHGHHIVERLAGSPVETSQNQSMEDDHFFLWEPSMEAVKTSNDVPKLLCTVMRASFALSLSRSKIYELINSGALPTVHIGRSIRLCVADLETFVQASIKG